MVCGRLPHEGKMVQTMQSILRGDFPAPHALNPGLSAELEQIVLTAMAPRAEGRYASAEALGHALSEYLHHGGIRVSSRSLGELMAFLFEPELLADGVELRQARRVLEQVPTWRRGGRPPAPDTDAGHTLSAPTAPAVNAATLQALAQAPSGPVAAAPETPSKRGPGAS
jgi:hypothetical protein